MTKEDKAIRMRDALDTLWLEERYHLLYSSPERARTAVTAFNAIADLKALPDTSMAILYEAIKQA